MTVKRPTLYTVLSFLLVGSLLTFWPITPALASQLSPAEPVQIAQADDQKPQSTEGSGEDDLDEDDC